jgi:hypothetical protein
MDIDVSQVTSHFTSPQDGFTTTTSGSVSSGAATVGLSSTGGYENNDVVVLIIDPEDSDKKQVFAGTMDTANTQVTGVKWVGGTNQSHGAGATVVDYYDAAHQQMMTKGILVHADQDGTLKAGAVDSSAVLANGVVTTAKIEDSAVSTAKIADDAVTVAKLTATVSVNTNADSGSINSASYQSYSSPLTVSVTTTNANAKVEVNWSADMIYATSTGSCFGQVSYSGANSGTGIERQATNGAGSERVPASVSQIFTLATAGTTTFELKCRGSSTAVSKHEDAILSAKVLQD